jgi:hypothetical protein
MFAYFPFLLRDLVEVPVALDHLLLLVLALLQQQQHHRLSLDLLLPHQRKRRQDRLSNLGC